MPLVTNSTKPVPPSSPNVPQTNQAGPQLVKHADSAYRGVTVDTRYISRQNLIMHVEGSRLTCNYYSQVIGLDSGTYGLGKATLAIHQQLKLIRNMEIRVTSPISYSQDPTTKEMVGVGTALVYPYVIPNEGDIFLADIGDGQEGVMQVTNSTRAVIHRDTCHEIEFKLIDYSNNDFIEHLNKKTIQVFYFERDFIKHGHNPLVYESEYSTLQILRDSYSRILDLYLRRYYSQEFTTLIVPDQSEYTYDPFMVRAFNSHFGRWDSNTYKHIRVLNADEDPAMKAFSFWDAFVHRDRNSLNSAFREIGVVPVTRFHNRSHYDGIRYSGLKRTLYPKDPMPNAQHGLGWAAKSTNDFSYQVKSPGPRRVSDFFDPTPELPAHQHVPLPNYDLTWIEEFEYCQTCADGTTTPVTPGSGEVDLSRYSHDDGHYIIRPVMSDGHYIFSRAFWENNRESKAQTKLELIIQDYFDNKQISYERLFEIYNDSNKWNAIDSFYYIPILLILIKVVIHAI